MSQPLHTVLQQFAETLETAHSRLSLLPLPLTELPWFEGKWTRKQVLGHLIDSAATNHQRFVRGQLAEHVVFPGYHADDWVRVQHYHELSWTHLLGLWHLYNQHLLLVARQIPADRLTHVVQVAAGGFEAPLDWWVTDYVRHLRHHLDQIFTGLDPDSTPSL